MTEKPCSVCCGEGWIECEVDIGVFENHPCPSCGGDGIECEVYEDDDYTSSVLDEFEE